MMRRLLIVFLLYAVPVSASADRTEGRKYVVPSTGASVDIPVSIFTEDAGKAISLARRNLSRALVLFGTGLPGGRRTKGRPA